MMVPPHARFITDCVREPAAASSADPAASAAEVRNWGQAIAIAEEHRVAAFVQQAIIRHGIDVPRGVEARLGDIIRAQVVRTMSLDSHLVRIGRAMQEVGCPLIVLKGPALSRTVYPLAALRPYDDLDLVVSARDEAQAVAVLARCGFTEVPFEAEVARRRAAPIREGAAYHRTFTLGAGGTLVDLHVDPLQLGLRPVCEAERWQRSGSVPRCPELLMLAPADQIVYLSVHAHKHGFSRLIWLKDLDLLIRTQGDALDWELVSTVACLEGVSASVWYALRLAQRLLATPVPRTAQRRLTPLIPIRLLYYRLWSPVQVAGLDGRMRRRAVQFHVAEGWRGVLPSLLVMGRRRTRLGALGDIATRSWTSASSRSDRAARFPAETVRHR